MGIIAIGNITTGTEVINTIREEGSSRNKQKRKELQITQKETKESTNRDHQISQRSKSTEKERIQEEKKALYRRRKGEEGVGAAG